MSDDLWTGELAALLLADARLPTGGHAHSAGLEAAVEVGLTPAAVPHCIEARLRTVGLVEASAAVLALRAARTSPTRLGEIQVALNARTPSAPLRHASGLLGRGLARLAGRLWPDHPGVAALGALAEPPLRPVALGVIAAATGMGEEQVARASLYDDAQTVAAAALKLLPVDPTEATRWILLAEPTFRWCIPSALAVEDPAQMPACTAPQVEQWSLEHHARTRRIFVA